MCNNLDLVNIKAYTKFGKIISFSSQDIEWKQIMTDGMMETLNDGWTEGRNNGQPKSSIAPLFQSGVIQSNLGYPNADYLKLLDYSKTMDSPEFFLYYLLQ